MGHKSNTQEWFLEKAHEAHGNRYDYSMSIYLRGCDKIDIICHKHGIFKQEAQKHLKGQGCSRCAAEDRSIRYSKTTDQFIKESILIHEGKYDYSLVDYKSGHECVKIICPIHGVFEQKPSIHTSGHGCKKCANALIGLRAIPIGANKKCPDCNNIFPYTNDFFYSNKHHKSGLSNYCKQCQSERTKKQRKENPIAYKESYTKTYKKRIKNGAISLSMREKRSNDNGYRVIGNLQSDLRYALKSSGNTKSMSSLKLFGCSKTFLISYIESLFKEGMTWDNYNRDGWWIDHIRPSASFNLNDEAQQRECFHYTNLQPMWRLENIQKGSWYQGKKHYHKK